MWARLQMIPRDRTRRGTVQCGSHVRIRRNRSHAPSEGGRLEWHVDEPGEEAEIRFGLDRDVAPSRSTCHFPLKQLPLPLRCHAAVDGGGGVDDDNGAVGGGGGRKEEEGLRDDPGPCWHWERCDCPSPQPRRERHGRWNEGLPRTQEVQQWRSW